MSSARLLNILLNIRDIDRLYLSLTCKDIDSIIADSIESSDPLLIQKLYELEGLIRSLREILAAAKPRTNP